MSTRTGIQSIAKNYSFCDSPPAVWPAPPWPAAHARGPLDSSRGSPRRAASPGPTSRSMGGHRVAQPCGGTCAASFKFLSTLESARVLDSVPRSRSRWQRLRPELRDFKLTARAGRKRLRDSVRFGPSELRNRHPSRCRRPPGSHGQLGGSACHTVKPLKPGLKPLRVRPPAAACQ